MREYKRRERGGASSERGEARASERSGPLQRAVVYREGRKESALRNKAISFLFENICGFIHLHPAVPSGDGQHHAPTARVTLFVKRKREI